MREPRLAASTPFVLSIAMVYVHKGQIVEKRHMLDPRRLLEWFQQLISAIGFFFITIVSPSASGQFIDARKKKDDTGA